MNAFDDGRVGITIVDPARGVQRARQIASLWDGMIGDLFMPRTATHEQMEAIRHVFRPNGSKLRAHLWTAQRGAAARDFGAQTVSDIVRLNPGVTDLDIEEEPAINRVEDAYTEFIRAVLFYLREVAAVGATDWLAHYPFGVNVAPFKATFLPKEWFTDRLITWTEQTYYGEMDRVSEAEAYQDLEDAGVPKERRRLAYGFATEPRGPDGRYDPDGKRDLAIPTLFYKGKLVRKLRRGVIFQDDLLANLGYLA